MSSEEKENPNVLKKRSAKWHEKNKPIPLIRQSDSPLVANLRKEESSIKSGMLGPLEDLNGLVTSFNFIFNGSRFAVNITLSVVHSKEMRLSYTFAPSILNQQDKIRVVDENENGGRNFFIVYSPECEALDIYMFLVSEIHPVLRGAGSEFVALQYFSYLSQQNSWIKSVRFATKKEDMKGVDLYVQVELDGVVCDVPIQVKSSKTGQDGHISKSRLARIPSIVIPVRPAYHLLHKQMLELLVQYARNGRVLHISP